MSLGASQEGASPRSEAQLPPGALPDTHSFTCPPPEKGNRPGYFCGWQGIALGTFSHLGPIPFGSFTSPSL